MIVKGWLGASGAASVQPESGLPVDRCRCKIEVIVRASLLLIPVCFLAACNTPEPKSAVEKQAAKNAPPPHFHPTNIAGFQKLAAHFKSVISLPKFGATPAGIQRPVSNTISCAEAALDEIATCSHGKLTFDNTIAALDDHGSDIGLTASRLNLVKETSTDAALREDAGRRREVSCEVRGTKQDMAFSLSRRLMGWDSPALFSH